MIKTFVHILLFNGHRGLPAWFVSVDTSDPKRGYHNIEVLSLENDKGPHPLHSSFRTDMPILRLHDAYIGVRM
jgi:hypothetical protein